MPRYSFPANSPRMPPRTNPQNVPTGKKSIVAVGSLARIAANIRDSHHEAMISPENAPSIAVKQPNPLDGTVLLLVSECSDAANGLVSPSFTNASSFSAANDQDQPVAATDFPMCAQPIGNSAASFCSAFFGFRQPLSVRISELRIIQQREFRFRGNILTQTRHEGAVAIKHMRAHNRRAVCR